jgi:hypothetical protein
MSDWNWDEILSAGLPPEQKAELAARFEALCPNLAEWPRGAQWLKERNWIHGFFRQSVQNHLDVDALVNETLYQYFKMVTTRLEDKLKGRPADEDTLKPAFRHIAKRLRRPWKAIAREYMQEGKHEDLVDEYYGWDKITEVDLEEEEFRQQMLAELPRLEFPRRPPPMDEVCATFLDSGPVPALLKRIAQSVLVDHKRNVGRIREDQADEIPEEIASEPAEIDSMLRRHILSALARLPAKQRAALILCGEGWDWLTSDESEPLLKPSLHWRTARAALAKRPLSGEEASRLFGRDVSPDAAKAAKKLALEFSFLLRRGVRPMRVDKLPPEFLARPSGGGAPRTRFSVGAGPVALEGSNVSEKDKDYIRGMPGSELPIPQRTAPEAEEVEEVEEAAKTEATRKVQSSLPIIELNSSPAPAKLDAAQAEALRKISYQCGCYFKGCMNCGDTIIVESSKSRESRKSRKVSKSGKVRKSRKSRRSMQLRKFYESGHYVFRSYSPKSVGWTFWCYECGAKDEQCWENCREELGREPRARSFF